MKKARSFLLTTALIFIACLISGCASESPRIALYDFGPLPYSNTSTSKNLAAQQISIEDIAIPEWLDSPLMHYRLNYASKHQVQPYANSQWVMSPGNLFEQRLKARLTRDGYLVLSEADKDGEAFSLRIEILDFIQEFGNVDRSQAQIIMRVTVFQNDAPIAQRTFGQQKATSSANAAGGAIALAELCDTLVDELLTWLTTQTKKQNNAS